MLLLVLQKDGREGFAGIQPHLTLHQIRKTDLSVPFDDDSTKKEQEADCVFCPGRFSEEHKGGEWIL
jgi:hypothetical protein